MFYNSIMVSFMCVEHLIKHFPIIYKSNRNTHILLNRSLLKQSYRWTNSQLNPQLSTVSVLYKAHSNKGWKSIAVNGQKLKANLRSDETLACEEGKDAVLHFDLMHKLQKCNSVSSQIETFCSLVSLTDEDIEKRKSFVQSLEDMLKIYFKSFKLHQFGSSVNGLGFKGCDMDVCLQTLFNNEECILLDEVPTLDSALNGITSQETLAHMNPMYMLRFVRRIIRKHSSDIKEPILFIKARCPIIRFYNEKYDVFCDFSCESDSSMRNTRLLRFVGHLDERFKLLGKVVRYWGKHGGFVGDIDMFNSYAFSLFVLYFLQNTNPPILPTVKEMTEKSNYLKYSDVGDVATMIEDLKKFPPSKNTSSIENLLRDFYFFYLNFNFENILLPFTSSSIQKSKFDPGDNSDDTFIFGTISIQDPFRHSFNTTGVTTYKYCLKFLTSVMQACENYQDNKNWTPRNGMWGLCSLFKPVVNESKLMKQWQQTHKHHIRLATKSDAASKVKNIFEHGLLFQCKEFKVNYTPDDHAKSILKLQCRVFKNTWQGRDVLFHKYLNCDYDPLKIEHLISNEIVKNQIESKRQVLCDFLCKCLELSEKEKSILLELDFMGNKYPYGLVIFLKEFIPNIFNKL